MSDERNDYGFDDPVWAHILRQRLVPYIPFVRRWWSEVESLSVTDTGAFEMDYYDEDMPPGLFYRFTRVAARSPIRGVQCFPFVPAGYLQISGVKGGSNKLLLYLCANRDFTIDEFTIVELHNLPSLFNQGQLLAFVPTAILTDVKQLGKWLYFTNKEISALIKRQVTDTVYQKAILKG